MNTQTKKSGKTKLSQSGKVNKFVHPVRGKVKHLVAFFLFGLIMLLGVFCAALWQNRTNLAEFQIRKFMAEKGYEAKLDVQQLSKSQITITNIVARKDKSVFFKSARMVLDFDLAKRKVIGVELTKPYLNVEFDTKGNITSSWAAQSTASAQQLSLPPNGITIKDAHIDWRLAGDENILRGTGQAIISAEIFSDDNWHANIAGKQAEFSTNNLRGSVQHQVFIETKDGKSFDIFGSIDARALSTNLLPAENLRAQSVSTEFKLHFTPSKSPDTPTLTGFIEAHISEISTQDYAAQKINLKIENLNVSTDGEATANWQIKTEGTRIRNTVMRAKLANALTAHNTMAYTPIAQHFTKAIYGKAERLLNGFALDGSGKFLSSNAGYEISLARPLNLYATKQTVIFSQISDDFIRFDTASKIINVQADINWSGIQALNLSNFSLNAKSDSGIKLDSVNNMQARIRSQKIWRMYDEKGDIRLSPFDLNFIYNNLGESVRTVTLSGALDYAGPVPGGFALGLKAGGDIYLRLQGRDFTLGYIADRPLSIAKFTNASGWTATSLEFILAPQADLIHTTAQSSVMRTTLKNVRTQIIAPENTRRLDARFERLDITTNLGVSPQDWQVQVKDADIKSEDFPAPGTHIITPTAVLELVQSKDGNMTFDITSPDTYMATDNVIISDLHINLNGNPDDIALKYQAGSVTMVGAVIPVLPMHGTARLKSGVLSGHAVAHLPLTKDTPIDIHYRSVNGQGSAKILIPKIIFEPDGLQPQYLVPILRGKLAEVSGEVSAEFYFVFGGGEPVQSSGWTTLKNLDIGTLVGPISGVNSHLTFTSIFPLKTAGVQTASMAEFNPGFPLNGGNVQFEIIPGGIKLHQVLWPIENTMGAPGKIFLTPTNWQFGNVENFVTVNVENIGLGTILANVDKDKLSATGQIYGTLPTKVKGVDVLIDGGILTVKDGGVIQYKTGNAIAGATQNETASQAFKALENFRYQQLEAYIDGPLGGNMALIIMFDGQNPNVLAGQPFLFNTVITGELTNIARNLAGAFSNAENLKRIIDIQDNGRINQSKPAR